MATVVELIVQDLPPKALSYTSLLVRQTSGVLPTRNFNGEHAQGCDITAYTYARVLLEVLCPGVYLYYLKSMITNMKSGVYRISSTLILYFDTQLVGDVGAMPTLQAATSFIGDALITCDVYLADGHSEWYLNTVSLSILFSPL